MMRLIAVATSALVLLAGGACGSSSVGPNGAGSGSGSGGSGGSHIGSAGSGSLTVLGASGSKASSGGASRGTGGANNSGANNSGANNSGANNSGANNSGANGGASGGNGSSANGSGGTNATGGTNGSGGAAAPSADCGAFTACGGDVVGVWNVKAICLQNPESILAGQLNAPECMKAVQNVKVAASGTYTFRADGTATTDVQETISLTLRLDSSCASAIAGQSLTLDAQSCASLQDAYQSGGSFATANCSFAQAICQCDLTSAEQDISGSGMYQVNGKTLNDTSGDSPFCVDGDVLTISSTDSGLTGTIVLRRN